MGGRRDPVSWVSLVCEIMDLDYTNRPVPKGNGQLVHWATHHPNVIQWEMIDSWPRRRDLKCDIVDRMMAWELRLKPMKRGRISSQCLQYVKNAEELQQPCIMTTHGSTPSNKKKVVPPILNPWPRTLLSPALDHTSRQRSRNQVRRRGAHEPPAVLKANQEMSLCIWKSEREKVTITKHPLG